MPIIRQLYVTYFKTLFFSFISKVEFFVRDIPFFIMMKTLKQINGTKTIINKGAFAATNF
jgi:hypothetical protein